MEIIYKPRQSGKTTELIRRSAEDEANGIVNYIVCHSHEEAYRISKLAEEMGLRIGFPITYGELAAGGATGRFIKHLYIDNVDMLISYLSPLPVKAITLSQDESVV